MHTSFAKKVKALKDAHEWSDSELARRAIDDSGKPLSRQAIWYALNKAKKLPTFPTIRALARAFGCSVDDLAR